MKIVTIILYSTPNTAGAPECLEGGAMEQLCRKINMPEEVTGTLLAIHETMEEYPCLQLVMQEEHWCEGLEQLKEAHELPQLFMKSKEEMMLWKTLRRISDSVHLQLDEQELDEASKVTEFAFNALTVKISDDKKIIVIEKHGEQMALNLEEMIKYPSKFFNSILKG